MALKKHSLATVAALTFAVTLGGCASSMQNANRSLDSIHQPVVGQSHYALDLSASGGTLSPSEQQRLSDWLGAMRLGYGDRVSIDDPAPYSNGGAHDAVANVVAKSGLLVSAGAPITQGQVPSDAIRVVVTRTVAEVPGCPDWSTKSVTNFSNATSSNFGCSVNSNLAGMVADPVDLLQGKSSVGQDPSSASKAIKAYRDAEPTGKSGLKKNDTQAGG